MNKVMFSGEECTVVLSRYLSSHNLSIRLVSADGFPFATASVNSRLPLDRDEVLIKSYSENEGMLEALLIAKIIEVVETIPTGETKLHLCRVLVDLP